MRGHPLAGRAEQAYLKALEHAPDNEKIRANYERFRLFYTDHLEQAGGEGTGAGADSNPAGSNGEKDD